MLAVDKVNNATLANGRLSLWTQTVAPVSDIPAGMLSDVFSAAYEIFDSSYTSVKAKASLDVGNAPTDLTPGNHAGKGHYVATWAPSGAVGIYFVRWYYRRLSGDPESSFDQEIELVALPYRANAPHYCAVQDLIDQGLPGAVTAVQAQRLIERSSRYAEMFTGRESSGFEARYKTLSVNGTDSRALQFNEPIVAVDSVSVRVDNVFATDALPIVSSTLKIFNRHLTSGQSSPDDRQNPKLEFVHGSDLGGLDSNVSNLSHLRLDSLIWPRGQQNVIVAGLFGFTEPDGSFTGKAPEMLREAVQLLCFRNLALMSTPDREAGLREHRLTLESTRDQSQQFAAPGIGVESELKAPFTGDPSIDSILLAFVRSPQFGAA